MKSIRTEKPWPSRQSVMGLNMANFFVAELAAVIAPFLAVYLKQKGWSYSQIGVAAATAGLGTLVFQTPAGYICDYFKSRRFMLGAACIIVGLSFALLPLLVDSVWGVNVVLTTAGAATAFFVPLLATLGLSLVGPRRFAKLRGQNQSFNHLGNIVLAISALFIVEHLGVESIFYTVAGVALLAVGALLIIKPEELDPNIGCEAVIGHDWRAAGRKIKEFFKNSQTRTLIIAIALFHTANTPVLALLGLYLKDLGSADDKVVWTVLVAQAVMVPTALLTGKYSEILGRKPLFAFAFLVLTVRIVLYTLTTDPILLLAIQALDGVAAGIYWVLIGLICSDLTEGKGGFNMLIGVAQTALALGGFIGPLAQGYLTDLVGFRGTFLILAAIAAVGAVLFMFGMRETKNPDVSDLPA